MSPQRGHTLLLAGATCLALSCSVLSTPSPLPEPHPEATARAPAPEPVEDAAVTQVRRELDSRRTGLADEELDELARTVVEEARRHDLDPALVMAVIHVESRYNAFAMSHMGALGLMQILPSTGEELARRLGIPWRGAQTLFDPIANVRLGVAYLRQLSRRYGDIPTALAAYNWGPGRIDRRLARGRALPTEYPRLVLEAHTAALAEGRSS